MEIKEIEIKKEWVEGIRLGIMDSMLNIMIDISFIKFIKNMV